MHQYAHLWGVGILLFADKDWPVRFRGSRISADVEVLEHFDRLFPEQATPCREAHLLVHSSAVPNTTSPALATSPGMHVNDGSTASKPIITTAIDHFADAHKGKSSSTHDAWLHRYIESAAV